MKNGIFVGVISTLFFSISLGVAPSGPWDTFNLAPSSRIIYPQSIRSFSEVDSPQNLLSDSPEDSVFLSKNSYVTLDFGKEVGGLISFQFGENPSGNRVNLSYTESPQFIRVDSDDSNGNMSWNFTIDENFSIAAESNSFYTVPDEKLRGGFRYLTLFLDGEGPLRINSIQLELTFSPHRQTLRDYSGYFYSPQDSILNQIWYGGAYTVQMCVLNSNQGRSWPPSPHGWANNGNIGVGSPVLSDGAKRDRTVWPGDLQVAVASQFFSNFEDLISTRNSLQTLFMHQSDAGELPFVGPPINFYGSTTYHSWALVGLFNYHFYTGDTNFVASLWENFVAGVEFLDRKVKENGLLYVDETLDWARSSNEGYNTAANCIYYRVLHAAVELGTILGKNATVSKYVEKRKKLKWAINLNLYDDEKGMYFDNFNTDLYPQDGNSLAILFEVETLPNRIRSISKNLQSNWNSIGSVCPELAGKISPFIGSFEIAAHFAANESQRALDLIRRQWGWMVTTEVSVQSTLLEGYAADGTLNYNYGDNSYTSHAHGWSTGPTYSLLAFAVGLDLVSPRGLKWKFQPHANTDLNSLQGGFETALGPFSAKWKKESKSFTATIVTPRPSSGNVYLPKLAAVSQVILNGKNVTYREEESWIVINQIVRGGPVKIQLNFKSEINLSK